MPSLAHLDMLAERLGEDIAGTPAGVRAQAALDDASALVRAEASKDWLDEDGELLDVPAIIEAITLAVAYRAYRNPEGTTQSTVGDVSVSYSRESGAGTIFLTRAEQRAVRKEGGRSAYGSIILESSHPLGSRDPLYAPVQGGGDMIPLGPVPWEDG